MTVNLYRVAIFSILSAITLIVSLSSRAFVCITPGFSSKSVRIQFQDISPQVQLKELQKYLQNSCDPLAVLVEFSQDIQIGTIEIEEETLRAPVLPRIDDQEDITYCTVRVPYFPPNKTQEKKISCRMKRRCPKQFLEKTLEWEYQEHSGDEMYGC